MDIFYKSRLPDLISSTPMSSMSPPSRPAPLLHPPSFALPPSLGAGNFLQNLPRSPFQQMSGIGRSAKVSEPFLRPHLHHVILLSVLSKTKMSVLCGYHPSAGQYISNSAVEFCFLRIIRFGHYEGCLV